MLCSDPSKCHDVCTVTILPFFPFLLRIKVHIARSDPNLTLVSPDLVNPYGTNAIHPAFTSAISSIGSVLKGTGGATIVRPSILEETVLLISKVLNKLKCRTSRNFQFSAFSYFIQCFLWGN